MNKLMSKLASAGTVALMGYEIGSHTSENDESKVTTYNAHNTEIVYIAIIGLICVFALIFAKMYMKMRQVVQVV